MQNAKPLIASWTFWFGLAQIATGAFGLLSGVLDQTAAFALIVTGLGSIGLRLKTDQPVSGFISSKK